MSSNYRENGHNETKKQAQQYKPKLTATSIEMGHKQTIKTSTTI